MKRRVGEKEGERERERERECARVERSGQELLNWSFDWTHRDGLNVISDWPGGREDRDRRARRVVSGGIR